jgi:polyphenol oxidase
MHTWHWQTWQDLPYLTCSVLEAFPHGFFTRSTSSQTPTQLSQAVHSEAPVYRVRQVHGNAVLTPTEISTALSEELPEDETLTLPPADGLVTEQAAQSIWVCTADCVPALVADVTTGQVAAVHAGWRGTAQEILPEAIARLQHQGSQLKDLRVALGPAIAGEVYQVSTTVAAQVGATVVKEVAPEGDLDGVLDALAQLPDSPLLSDPDPQRVRLDVRRVNALQLKQLGFSPEQIAIAPYCTYQHGDRFFSYRRERLKKVQWSGIVSQNRKGEETRLIASLRYP